MSNTNGRFPLNSRWSLFGRAVYVSCYNERQRGLTSDAEVSWWDGYVEVSWWDETGNIKTHELAGDKIDLLQPMPPTPSYRDGHEPGINFDDVLVGKPYTSSDTSDTQVEYKGPEVLFTQKLNQHANTSTHT